MIDPVTLVKFHTFLIHSGPVFYATILVVIDYYVVQLKQDTVEDSRLRPRCRHLTIRPDNVI